MRSILQICLLFVFQIVFSQTTQGKYISSARNDDKSVTLTFNGETAGSTYVILKFKQLTNASSSQVLRVPVKGFSAVVATLYPINNAEHIGYSYTYRTITGDINAKPDSLFKYVLPFKNGKEVKVQYLSFLGERMGGKKPKNWSSFQFLAQPNDTVCAIRKGVVVRITDGNAADKKLEYGYKTKANSMLVEHEDGTMASYGVLKKGSFMVEVGDIVYPSTPLAIAGTYDKEENSQVRISVYYLDDVVKNYDFSQRSKESYATRTNLYAYVNPLFVVNSDGSGLLHLDRNQVYTSYSDPTIIQSEMTKRERKKYLKKKG